MCSNCTADLLLCFRLCMLVFLCDGSFPLIISSGPLDLKQIQFGHENISKAILPLLLQLIQKAHFSVTYEKYALSTGNLPKIGFSRHDLAGINDFCC